MERLHRLVEDLKGKCVVFEKLDTVNGRELTMGELQVKFEFPGELTAAEAKGLERAVREYGTNEWASTARVFSGSGKTIIEMRPPELVHEDFTPTDWVAEDDVIARACVRPKEWRITRWHVARLLDAFAYTDSPQVFVMDLRELSPAQVEQFMEGVTRLVARLVGVKKEEAEDRVDDWFDSGVVELLKWFAEAFNSGMLDEGGW